MLIIKAFGVIEIFAVFYHYQKHILKTYTGGQYVRIFHFDTVSKKLAGSEIISFKNESSKPISCLALDWSLGSHQSLTITINRQLILPVTGDSSNLNFGALVWQGHIFEILGKRDMAIREYKLALAKETGQGLNHGQYDMIIDRKWVEERLQKPFIRK